MGFDACYARAASLSLAMFSDRARHWARRLRLPFEGGFRPGKALFRVDYKLVMALENVSVWICKASLSCACHMSAMRFE
jgi:hypothetical protein